MSAPTAGNVVVSYRGIASLFEGIDLDERAAPGTPTRTEAGEDAIVRAAEGDPIAELGAPAQPEPAAPEDLSDIDDLQRIAMIAGLRRAIDEIARADKTPGVLFAPEDQASSLLLAYLSQQGLSSGKLAELGDGRYEVKFDDRDLTGWVGSFFRDWIKRLRKHRFLAPPAAPEVIGNTCRVALLGDWGTGLYGAPRCALSIKEAKPAFDVVVHLGDIYYAGNPGEVRERFLAHWPEVPGALSRAVNANHEMYSGGEGYFGGVLPAFGQGSSVFALQNDHFLVVGLDTGYDEHDLAGGQAEWLMGLAAQAGDRKIVLLSHHQPFSVFESQGTKLVRKLRPLLSTGRIFAWYWGHEHRCMVYDKHPEWELWGRLIGHSGYPYFRRDFSAYPIEKVNSDGTSFRLLAATDSAPRSVLLEGPNPYVTDAPGRYGPHGFASIELDGPRLMERILAADGTVLHEKELT